MSSHREPVLRDNDIVHFLSRLAVAFVLALVGVFLGALRLASRDFKARKRKIRFR